MSGYARPAGVVDNFLEASSTEVTAAYLIAPNSWAQDILDVAFNGILNDATRATAGCRVRSAMPIPSASEGPPSR
jgi:hypothetical protein